VAMKPLNQGEVMERKYEIGQHVIFVDSRGRPHDAIITHWWYGKESGMTVEAYLSQYGDPGCNLCFVTADSMKRDDYGQQIERQTSIVHKRKQAGVHGNYWCWPDEN
jgi:hypothetical protein